MTTNLLEKPNADTGEKLSFFSWYAERESGEPHLTAWIEGFAKDTAWKSYRTGRAVHDGDCVNMPYTCNLCALTDLLMEYREYILGGNAR